MSNFTLNYHLDTTGSAFYSAVWDIDNTSTDFGQTWTDHVLNPYPNNTLLAGSGTFRFVDGLALSKEFAFSDVKLVTANTAQLGQVKTAILSVSFFGFLIPDVTSNPVSLFAKGLPFDLHPNPVNSDWAANNAVQTWTVDVTQYFKGINPLDIGSPFSISNYAPSAFALSFDHNAVIAVVGIDNGHGLGYALELTCITLTVTNVSPNFGSRFGGTHLTITGNGFSGSPIVLINGIACTSVVLVSDTIITCISPESSTTGNKVVTVTIGAESDVTKEFTYMGATITSTFPASGGVFGGASVAVYGTGFVDSGTVISVLFGSTPATGIFVLSDTVLSCINPAHDAGGVTISIEFNGSYIATSATDVFTYDSPFILENPTTTPIRIGDTIVVSSDITSPGMIGGVKQIQLSYINPITNLVQIIAINSDDSIIINGIFLNGVIVPGPNGVVWHNTYPIIIKRNNVLWLNVPFILLNYPVPINFSPIGFDPITFVPIKFSLKKLRFKKPSILLTVKFVGDGLQFSGSVLAGTLTVLLEDSSGIYTLDKDQTSDILYFRDGYTTNINMLMLPEEDMLYEDSFFDSLSYPYRILSPANLNEDEYEDFSVISTLQVVVNLLSTRIPSPFIKTAFLP
jgi:hypothetical protein